MTAEQKITPSSEEHEALLPAIRKADLPIEKPPIPSYEVESEDTLKEKKALAASKNGSPNALTGKTLPETALNIGMQILTQPALTLRKSVQVASEVASALRGESPNKPDRRDRRFKDEAWRENYFYHALAQSYLAWRKGVNEWVDESDLAEDDEVRARFLVNLLTEAASPSNTLLNPAALKRAQQTNGKSLLEGMSHMVQDMVHNGGLPSQVKDDSYRLGENIAITPGKVVFRTDVLELIQYIPQTTEVYTKPVLIIPPQINKFYIFDLDKRSSMVEYLLSQGNQVFIVSWRNPGPEYRHWNLETYIQNLDNGIDCLLDITESDQVNVVGACAGGVTLSALLGYYAAKRVEKVSSATFLVSVFEASGKSLMSLFANDKSVASAKERSQRQGVLDGKDMARVFAWLKPNEMIWMYWVNNYLMGKEPPTTTTLYWNNDSTRLPAGLHSDFLDIYEANALATPNKLKISGMPIDISKIKVDAYFVAGQEDHLANWQGCYSSAQCFTGRKVFVLAGESHIQCILRPMRCKNSSYYVGSYQPERPEDWLALAQKQKGSWWGNWAVWVQKHGGEMKPAPEHAGNSYYPALDNAPGQYVREK